MTKEEYLDRFMAQLTDFRESDKKQIQEYFQEMIYDRMEEGETEEEVLKAIGSPEEAAARLCKEYDVRVAKDLPSSSYQNTASKAPLFVSVQAEDIPIEVRIARDGDFKVLFTPREGLDQVTVSETDGGYIFCHKIKKLWFFDMWHIGKSNPIIVEFPVNYSGQVQLITKNASILIDNPGCLRSLYARTSNGKITASGIKTRGIMPPADNRNIPYVDVESGEIRLESSNGKLDVSDIAADRIRLKSSNGPISLIRAESDRLNIKTSNGRITLQNGDFSQCAELQTSNGAIDVADLKGPDITIQTSNGAVKGWLCGSIADYDIDSHTSNASSTLPTHMHQGKGHRLNVYTSNAKIKLAFEK